MAALASGAILPGLVAVSLLTLFLLWVVGEAAEG